MTTSLTRVRRSHVIYIDTVFLGLVFDVALKFTERPLLELGGVRDTLADMLQFSNAIAVQSFSTASLTSDFDTL